MSGALTATQLNELKHFHVFGDSLVPIANKAAFELELYEMQLLDRSGPEVVFCNRPIPSHWRYSLNDAGREAIIVADGCLPKPYDWEAVSAAMDDDVWPEESPE